MLDVYALRFVGAAREGAYFATAPFAGALLAIPVLGEPFARMRLSGVGLGCGSGSKQEDREVVASQPS